MAKSTRTHMLQVRVNDNELKQFNALAKLKGVSVYQLIRDFGASNYNEKCSSINGTTQIKIAID